jgi:hypothetical protein
MRFVASLRSAHPSHSRRQAQSTGGNASAFSRDCALPECLTRRMLACRAVRLKSAAAHPTAAPAIFPDLLPS